MHKNRFLSHHINTKEIFQSAVHIAVCTYSPVTICVVTNNFIITLLLQATLSEGRPVDRACAWCNMIGVPFFRFSPQLSEDVGLDCTDDQTLINMLWETQCYINEHRERFTQLASVMLS